MTQEFWSDTIYYPDMCNYEGGQLNNPVYSGISRSSQEGWKSGFETNTNVYFRKVDIDTWRFDYTPGWTLWNWPSWYIPRLTGTSTGTRQTLLAHYDWRATWIATRTISLDPIYPVFGLTAASAEYLNLGYNIDLFHGVDGTEREFTLYAFPIVTLNKDVSIEFAEMKSFGSYWDFQVWDIK